MIDKPIGHKVFNHYIHTYRSGRVITIDRGCNNWHDPWPGSFSIALYIKYILYTHIYDILIYIYTYTFLHFSFLHDIHTYIHTYIHTDRQTDRQTDRHTYIHPNIWNELALAKETQAGTYSTEISLLRSLVAPQQKRIP